MNKIRGFTLIELMVVIAILCILAAIAVPAYKTHIAKVQVTEIVNVLTRYKTEIAETVSMKNLCPVGILKDKVPNTYQVAFGGAGNIGGKKYTCMVLVMTQSTSNSKLSPEVADNVIVLAGRFNTGSIEWVCRTTIKQAYVPNSCEGGLSSTEALGEF